MAQFLTSEPALSPATLRSAMAQMEAASNGSDPIKVLLTQLKLLKEARLQASASALPFASNVEKPAMKRRHMINGNVEANYGIFQEDLNQQNHKFAPLTDIGNQNVDADQEWCDTVFSGSEENASDNAENIVIRPGMKRKDSGPLSAESALEVRSENFQADCYAEDEAARFDTRSFNLFSRQLTGDLSPPVEFGYYSDSTPTKVRMADNAPDCSSVPAKKQRQKRGTATDPQSLAARARREKIASKIRRLQGLVPGTDKLDTASMLEQAIEYVQHLRSIVDGSKSGEQDSAQSKQIQTGDSRQDQ